MRRFIGFVFLATTMSLAAQDQSGGGNRILPANRPTPHTAPPVQTRPAPMQTPAGLSPAATLTLLDTDGPGTVSHLWFTISSDEPYHLKRIVLRMYWDGETTPSVEVPIGDFFGLGLGEYYSWQSQMLSVGSENSLNSFFPMPFQRHARITVTNEGKHAGWELLFQHRLPDGIPSAARRHPVFSCAISSGPAQPWVDKRLDKQRRSARG